MNMRPSTADPSYTKRLVARGDVWWKRLLNVQAPYRWNLRRLHLGLTLELGCGIGRNLGHLRSAIGIDHNPQSVLEAKARGCEAYLPEEFSNTDFNSPQRFDSILVAHVLEHLSEDAGVELVRQYLPLLKTNGRVVFITPQEAGYRSDTTHVRFVDFGALRKFADACRLKHGSEYSFPFPRFVGWWFKYNEFVSIAQKSTAD